MHASPKGFSPITTFILLGLCASVSLGACGGAEPEPTTAHEPVAKTAPKRKSAMAVSGQLGSLDPRQVDAAFNSLTSKFGQCIGQASSRIEFIGGHVKFFVRIGMDGRARWAYLSESTMGDRSTERCMLDVVRGARWPEPVAGDGEAQKSFDFDPSPDTRQAVAWTSERVEKPIAGARPQLDECRASAPGHYKVTLYVQPDGSALAAGVATPNQKGEPEAAECIANALKTLKYPSPGSWPAKVEFDLL
jgi:hypothetical protein